MSGLTRKLKVGIVGVGNIAAIAQLPTLADRPDIELTAVVTRRADPSALLRRWPFEGAYPTVQAMIESVAVDAVFILTPRQEHAEAVELCLNAGIDVFCEKPLATRAADAVRLADVADARGRILMVGLNRRFTPVYEAGKEAFEEHGAAFCIAQKNRNGSEFRATFENSIHMVDLLRWYCGGSPTSVTASSIAPDPWQEEGVSALVQFDNGHSGVLVAARNAGRWEEKLDAYGSATSVYIEAPDRITISASGSTSVREIRSESFGWGTVTKTFGFAKAVEHFIDRVRDRAQPLTSGREAALTQLLLDDILSVAGLPTEEDPQQVWVSHSQA